MNQKKAKALRRIARGLHLSPTTEYAPVGKLRRRPPREIRDAQGRVIDVVEGPPIPRPLAMRECERRAYQEAKKLYRQGQPSGG